MNRIDRLSAIWVQLQGKARVPLAELEERFEVSRRTIFRDIKSLIEAGVPIGGDAGEGYFIVEGYHLPPVVFNKEEASAILLGAKLTEKHADAKINQAFKEGMHKVRAVLKYSDKDFLESLDERIEIIATPKVMNHGFPDSHISDIQVALATKRVLQIGYHSNYNDADTSRAVEPLGLVYYSNRWHLIGFCRLRQDMRDFRTDRIRSLKITSELFDPSSHPDFMEFTSGMLGGTDAKEAVVRFKKEVTRFISDEKYYHGFIEERPCSDGTVEMKFITPHYEYLARWLLMFTANARVVSPPELQGIVATLSKDLFEHHRMYFAEATVQT